MPIQVAHWRLHAPLQVSFAGVRAFREVPRQYLENTCAQARSSRKDYFRNMREWLFCGISLAVLLARRRRSTGQRRRLCQPEQWAPSDDHYAYLAVVVAGLEYIAVGELKHTLGITEVKIIQSDSSILNHRDEPGIKVASGRAGVGKMVFRIRKDSFGCPRSLIKAIGSLRSVQAVYALICVSTTIPSGFEVGCDLRHVAGPKSKGNRRRKLARAGKQQTLSQPHEPLDTGLTESKTRAIEQVAQTVLQGDWSNAEALWWLHVGVELGAPSPSKSSGPSKPRPLKFRVSAVRGGKHNFSSVEVAAEVGAAIAEGREWVVSLTDYECEVTLILLQGRLVDCD